MSSSGLIQVPNETHSTSSRITKEGRKITYRMTVIQQPERARACGSGAKSSADRRPVDPPPIVELRVFEGHNAEHDITFSYKANFFLFATLEQARHVAHGRVVPPPSQPAFPVLTGTPVAGMAYLDRPQPAGYFIFPDLSVRHEGKYRLAFSLYEELKEQKDMDTETPSNVEIQKSAHVSHRLEVKSIPFTVFSAKRFPGLAESTQLSRIVAEQGCRVRIRRDVRMRRRNNEKSARYEEDYDEDHHVYDKRARISATPEYPPQAMGHRPSVDEMNRPRSSSNASNASNAAYMPHRRPSSEQLPQPYQQPYAASPVTPQASQGMYPPQGQVQPQWHNQPPQPVGYMPPPPPSYSQPSYQSQPAQPMGPPYNYMPPYAPYENGHMRHNSVEYPHVPPRQTSTPQPQPPMHQPPQPPMQTTSPTGMQAYGNPPPVLYGRPSASNVPPMQPPQPINGAQQQPPHNSTPQIPPVQSPVGKRDSASHFPPVQAPPPAETQQQPPQASVSPVGPARAPSSGPGPTFYDQNANGPPTVTPPKFALQPQPSGATKRAYSASFDTEPLEQPLRHGARPPATGAEPKYSFSIDGGDDDGGMLDESTAMHYRRADGTERRRRVPVAN